MRTCIRFLPLIALAFTTVTHAGLLSGFENGLQGWDYIGDTSIQNSSIGLAATQGRNFAFLTTLSTNAATPRPETPYSGVNSPRSNIARDFLGIQTAQVGIDDPYMVGFPMVSTTVPGGGNSPYAIYGESAAIKTSFTANRPGYISFDWDRIGIDGDNAYFTIWSETLGKRINGWVYDYHTSKETFSSVNVGLCDHVATDSTDCDTLYNQHTGWHTLNVWIDTPGVYNIGFGMNEAAESSVPTILALDNVRFTVPEPGSIALLGLSLAGMTVLRRRKS